MKLLNATLALLMCLAMTACVGEGDDDDGTGPEDEQVPIDAENMIDDFEDGDDAITSTAERSGDWYSFNDGTGGEQSPGGSETFLPEEGGPEGSAYAGHTSGSGWSEWGAGIGFDINAADPDSTDITKGTFDASAFTGIAFMAKGTGSVRAMVAMFDLIGEAEGGGCDTADGECENHYGKVFELTDEWGQYLLPFDSITQEEGWGQELPFDPTNIASLLWQTGPNADFDYWVDEVGLYVQ